MEHGQHRRRHRHHPLTGSDVTKIKPKRPPTLVRCLAVLVVIVSAVACASRAGEAVDKQASYDQQLRELLQRPDIDDAVARYDQMRTEIRDRLVSEIGIMPWKDDHDGSASGCREFPRSEERRVGK